MFFDPDVLAAKLMPVAQKVGEGVAAAVKQLGRNQTRMFAMQALIMQSDPATFDAEDIARKAEQIARAMEVYDG